MSSLGRSKETSCGGVFSVGRSKETVSVGISVASVKLSSDIAHSGMVSVVSVASITTDVGVEELVSGVCCNDPTHPAKGSLMASCHGVVVGFPTPPKSSWSKEKAGIVSDTTGAVGRVPQNAPAMTTLASVIGAHDTGGLLCVVVFV